LYQNQNARCVDDLFSIEYVPLLVSASSKFMQTICIPVKGLLSTPFKHYLTITIFARRLFQESVSYFPLYGESSTYNQIYGLKYYRFGLGSREYSRRPYVGIVLVPQSMSYVRQDCRIASTNPSLFICRRCIHILCELAVPTLPLSRFPI
jgi:hypothetical protein